MKTQKYCVSTNRKGGLRSAFLFILFLPGGRRKALRLYSFIKCMIHAWMCITLDQLDHHKITIH